MDIIVGTAGHIDHGKTALVRALTGTDADRLPEEKLRGITIDIGFAELELDDVHFGFVDVPGHERFVKNMLAGAHGIDLVLLVIAADEGVMPQTREHFDICRLLGLSRGVVVLTKFDLADEETLELARMDAAELVEGSFLEKAPIVNVSSLTGEGLAELKGELIAAAREVPARSVDRSTFLPIDRSFTVKGFGAVVTGTLSAGQIDEGAELELLPEGRKVRVRGVQTHGKGVSNAGAGVRTAVNLAGIDHSEIARGMAAAEPGVFRPTQIIDTFAEILPGAPRPLRSRQRVRVHIGTAEVLARVHVLSEGGTVPPGSGGFIQLRLESPIVCVLGDRFILRSYSPQRTVGGGQILLSETKKHRRAEMPAALDLLGRIESNLGDNAEITKLYVERSGTSGLSIGDLRAMTGWRSNVAEAAIRASVASGSVERLGDVLVGFEAVETLRSKALSAVEELHKREPLASGFPRETLRETTFRKVPSEVFSAVVASLAGEKKITVENDLIRAASHSIELSKEEEAYLAHLMNIYEDAGYEPPKLEDALSRAGELLPNEARKLLQMKIRGGDLVKVTEEFLFSAAAIERLKQEVRGFADSTEDRLIDVPKFKEIAGISRKYAIPLLEYFDRERVTLRAGDKRVVLK